MRYGAVVVASALALALGQDAAHGWHLKLSFVTFYLALIMVVAWIGGLWPGVLSTLACTVIATYFWAEPINNFAVESREDAISLLLFAILGVTAPRPGSDSTSLRGSSSPTTAARSP